MKLIPFSEFPLHERDAVLTALARLRIPPVRVCVSRLQPVAGMDDPALASVALVSAPGWSRAYEGADWVASLEQDLLAVMPARAPAAATSLGAP
jgi:hypothetical protein